MSLASMLEQRIALDKQIEELRKASRKETVLTIKELMELHDITVEDLAKKTSSAAGVKVPPKWQDPVSGAKWTGRGRTPVWFDEATAIKL